MSKAIPSGLHLRHGSTIHSLNHQISYLHFSLLKADQYKRKYYCKYYRLTCEIFPTKMERFTAVHKSEKNNFNFILK